MKHGQTLVVAIATTSLASLWSVAGLSVADAYDYCRQDVTGHMTSCSFDTMEQCEATRSGIGGDCFRNPFMKYHSAAYARGTTHPGSRGQAAGDIASDQSIHKTWRRKGHE